MRVQILESLFSQETMQQLSQYYHTDPITGQKKFAKDASTLQILRDPSFLAVYLRKLVSLTSIGVESQIANRLLERVVTLSQMPEFEDNERIQSLIYSLIPQMQLYYIQNLLSRNVQKAKAEKQSSIKALSEILSPELIHELHPHFYKNTHNGLNYGFDVHDSVMSILRANDTTLLAKLLTEASNHVEPKSTYNHKLAEKILTSIGLNSIKPEFIENSRIQNTLLSWNGDSYFPR